MKQGVQAAQWLGPRPMVWLGFGITLAAAPLMFILPFWLGLWAVVLTGWRVVLAWHQRALPSEGVRRAALGVGIGVVLSTHGLSIDTDATVGMLTVLVGLKLLEMRTRRDFLIAMFIGFFLILSFCFYEGSLATTLYSLLPATCLLAGALQVSGGRWQPMHWRQAIFATCRMMVLALPLTVVLFVFFPRMPGYFAQASSSKVGTTGISDQVYPGSVRRVTESQDVAFRAMLEGENPPPVERYWRGLVLLDCRGMAWSRGRQERAAPQLVRASAPVLRQRITLEPHNQKWLFALDRPVAISTYDVMFATQTFEDGRAVTRSKQYEVASSMERVPRIDFEATLARARRVDYEPDARVRAYVAALKSAHGDDAQAIAGAIMQAFAGGFTYTLEPGEYASGDPLAEFFFERRKGFCEHFAATFATLMRLAGVPSRLVIGYQGGEVNRHGGYIQVRQNDAHAWVEVWIPQEGWVRIDPTSVVAPVRLQRGMRGFVELGGESRGASGDQLVTASAWKWWRELVLSLRDRWDNLDYQWVLLVMDYDRGMQRGMMREMGVSEGQELLWSTAAMAAVGAVFVAILAGLLLHRKRASDPVRKMAQQFCRVLKPAGGSRPDWEPLNCYVERVAGRLPEPVARAARSFAAEHAQIRYGPAGDASAETLRRRLRQVVRLLRADGKHDRNIVTG
jgi:transglutaminase-like putative cysteine protease